MKTDLETKNNKELPYLSSGEAAALLGKHQMTVLRLLRKGQLQGERIGGTWYVNRAALYRRLGMDEKSS